MAAPTVPQWLIGRYVTSIASIPATVSGGTWTAGSSTPLTGLLDEIQWSGDNELEDITPFDTRQKNHMITGTDWSLELTEILSQASTGNVLSAIGMGSDYVSITFTRGTKVFTCYFVVGSYRESLVRGKSVGVLSLKPVGAAPTLA